MAERTAEVCDHVRHGIDVCRAIVVWWTARAVAGAAALVRTCAVHQPCVTYQQAWKILQTGRRNTCPVGRGQVLLECKRHTTHSCLVMLTRLLLTKLLILSRSQP